MGVGRCFSFAGMSPLPCIFHSSMYPFQSNDLFVGSPPTPLDYKQLPGGKDWSDLRMYLPSSTQKTLAPKMTTACYGPHKDSGLCMEPGVGVLCPFPSLSLGWEQLSLPSLTLHPAPKPDSAQVSGGGLRTLPERVVSLCTSLSDLEYLF